MQISEEKPNLHSIQSYSDVEIKINDIVYTQSLIVSSNAIITGWPVHLIEDLTLEQLQPILDLNPKIIILGHQSSTASLPMAIRAELSKHGIGIDCMSIGAASRTFNVLLSEEREVIFGVVFCNNQ